MTIPIPPDEALRAAYYNTPQFEGGLRAVAHLAAKQAAEQAVKEVVLHIEKELSWLSVKGYARSMLRRDFPSAFTPTPPKEQPVHTADKPSPDPATATHDDTVRSCIAYLHSQGFSWAHAADAHLSARFLPKPTPAPEPERYVTVEEVADAMKDIGGTLVDSRCAVLSRLDKHAAKRGPMLKESDARRIALNANAMPDTPQDEILAALRRAAKGGEGK